MFAAVVYNEIDIFYVILHDKFIMWVSSWATAPDIVFYLKIKRTLKIWYRLLSFMKIQKNVLFMTSQLPL